MIRDARAEAFYSRLRYARRDKLPTWRHLPDAAQARVQAFWTDPPGAPTSDERLTSYDKLRDEIEADIERSKQ